MNEQQTDIVIRRIEPADAAAYLALCQHRGADTTLMMLEPGERATTANE